MVGTAKIRSSFIRPTTGKFTVTAAKWIEQHYNKGHIQTNKQIESLSGAIL